MYPYLIYLYYQNNSDGMRFVKSVFWLFVIMTIVGAIMKIWQLIQEKDYGTIPKILLLALGIILLPIVIIAMIAISAGKQQGRH